MATKTEMAEKKEMQADMKWLDTPSVFRVNQLPARSDHTWYASRQEWKVSESSFKKSLNGIWKFQFSKNVMERPTLFYREDFDSSNFSSIQVPGHIELSGYDQVRYINQMYPWEGYTYKRPPYTLGKGEMPGLFSEDIYNPTGSYLCRFDLEKSWVDKNIQVGFDGAEQAMYLWLNGHFIGYAEDSFTPSFFDLTPFVREKDNVLAVQVHKQSTAGFLEDQDFFRFFGIFRDVNLYCLPALHVEDVWLQPRYDAVHGSGQLSGTLTLAGKMKGRQVHCCLYDPEDRKVWDAHFAAAHRLDFSADRMEVLPWEIYDGNVYRLEIQIQNEKGETEEFVPVQTGFRSIVLKNGLVLLNGRRLVINGVNRHEWSAEKGRCVGEREEIQDIEILKRNAINGVRTSHYPNRLSWYRRCDEAGIFLMAEVNLESHGSWQKRGAVEPSWNVPGECSPWFEGVLDRARTMFHTLKNHPAILFWSLGNESYAGRGLEKMQVLFKELDPERLVHYEGVYHHPAYKKTISDVESQMYAPPARIEAYLQNEGNKPFILCEFMHCMGNSVGGLGEYMELLDKYPAYQGGFIWDYMDQALWVKDPVSGEKVLAYGGDFDDRPTDYEFSGNGLLFADRTEKPAMQEVRYYYEKYKR